MRSAQFTIDEVFAVFRRRKKLLRLPPIIVATLCVAVAFILPRKYESSTTILVQRDEVLNPLVSFTMAVSMASEDRLRSFDEIIYSRSTIESLIDTLGIGGTAKSEEAQYELIKEVRKNIETNRRGSDSFTLSYLDTDPVRAQRAVSILSGLFIRTRLHVENQRNEMAVEFFERKLEDFRVRFETSQKEVLSLMRQRIQEMPTESRTLYGQIDETDRSIGDIDGKIKTLRRALTILRSFPDAFQFEEGGRSLFELERMDIPFSGDLRPLLTKYEEIAKKYTAKFPEVERLRDQILDVVERIRSGVETELAKQQTKRWELEKRRNQTVEAIQHTTVTQKADEAKQANYGIYRNLYDEMKVKLEQARTNRDLGKKGAEQFIVIDPPRVPTEPSKPNRLMIIGGGSALGLLLGLFTAVLAELIDTRVRSPQDLESFGKPIIAYIMDGESGTQA